MIRRNRDKLNRLAMIDPIVNSAFKAIFDYGMDEEITLVDAIEALVQQNEELKKRLLSLYRTLPVQPVIFPSYPKE